MTKVAPRHRVIAIGMLAVAFACTVFTLIRLLMQLQTGRATPWWGNAAGALCVGLLYWWYGRSPERRSGFAVHGTAAAATIALWIPVFYGMSSSKWWLSLVGFAVLLMGSRREAIFWATLTALMIPLTAAIEPLMVLPDTVGEPVLERVAAGSVYVIILFGITLAYRREAELRATALEQTARSLERANTVRNRFLAHMSHEIRTPLHGVIAMTDLAMNEALSPSTRQQLDGVYESAQVLLTLLNNLLDVTRVEAGAVALHAKPFDVHRALAESLRPLAARARATGLRFEAVADAGIPSGRIGDRIRLMQVIINLVSNAVKFTTAGGVSIRLRESADGGRVTVSVADTGPGIAPEDRERVFQPFTQAIEGESRFERGAGVGLSIASAITRMMDGEITIDEAPGGGACFTLDVALARDPAVLDLGPVDLLAMEPESDRIAPTSVRSLRVLVCEDERMNRRAVRRMLLLLGHEGVAVSDGIEAWERVREEPFDLLLTDVEMPRMDGVGLIQRIRELEAQEDLPRLPIVACTAHVGHGDQHRLLDAGADSHLAKPFTAEGLEKVLSASMEISRQMASADVAPPSRM